MSWYSGTYRCGHEGRVNIVGPTKNRQWIADHKFEGLCPECFQRQLEAQREAENIESAEKAEEMELPELTGSERQVAWANTLRQKFIDKTQKFSDMSSIDFSKVSEALQYILITYTKASWYIDNRNSDVKPILAKAYEDMQRSSPTADTVSANEIKAESTVFPSHKITEVPVEITVKDSVVSAITEKNDKFVKIVKGLGYKWNGSWERRISPTTGSAVDRAAELGNALLIAGFPVIITDTEIRQKAIQADFEPECKRWILYAYKGDFKGCLAITWEKGNEKIYQCARKLPRAKYSNDCFYVKMEYFREVLDFVDIFGFKISQYALEEIEKYKSALNDTPVTPMTAAPVPLKDGLSEILQSGSEVIDDLKD